MSTWRIAVGSLRRPKLDAVKAAVALITPLLGTAVESDVVGYEVESGVSHTPTSREELMRGARQRAEALVEKLRGQQQTSARLYVGLEGGLDVVSGDSDTRIFLESWAYATDGIRGHFGCSGSIEVPQPLAEEVLTRGIELGVAIDQYAGAVGVRDGQGAWGILSGNLISRQDSFRLAVIAALAPFYNARMYPTTSSDQTATSASPSTRVGPTRVSTGA
jgi:inosine/xanthosine triphosphatase